MRNPLIAGDINYKGVKLDTSLSACSREEIYLNNLVLHKEARCRV